MDYLTLSKEEIKKWQSVRKDYFAKVNELKKAMLADPEFAGMKLENRDLQAIIDGEYVIPSWNDKLSEENKEKLVVHINNLFSKRKWHKGCNNIC